MSKYHQMVPKERYRTSEGRQLTAWEKLEESITKYKTFEGCFEESVKHFPYRKDGGRIFFIKCKIKM